MQIKWNYVYEDGDVMGTMAIVRDITQRKQMEERLQKAHSVPYPVLDNCEYRLALRQIGGVY